MESPRLEYERINPDTLDPLDLYQYVKREAPGIDEITRCVRWEPYDHPKQVQDWIADTAEQFQDGELATYVVRSRHADSAREFVGLGSLDCYFDRQLATIGAWFRQSFWGRGFFGELAARYAALAFEDLDLRMIAITHSPDNDRSERAITKFIDRFGGRREGVLRNDISMNGTPRDSVRYTLSREEWAHNRD